MEKETEDYLKPFLFRYVSFSKQWAASTNQIDLWNDLGSDIVLMSSDINTLIDLIQKYKGDIKKLKKELN